MSAVAAAALSSLCSIQDANRCPAAPSPRLDNYRGLALYSPPSNSDYWRDNRGRGASSTIHPPRMDDNRGPLPHPPPNISNY